MKVLSKGSELEVDDFIQQLLSIMEENVNFLYIIFHDEVLQMQFYQYFPKITTSQTLQGFISLILHIIHISPTRSIDSDFLISTRDFFPRFPQIILNFYSEVSAISRQCQNAMFCLGIVNDIIEYCKDDNPDIQRQASHTLISVFSSKYKKFETNTIETFFPALVELLEKPNSDIDFQNTILLVLTLICDNPYFNAGNAQDLVSVLYSLNVHSLIIERGFLEPLISERCFSLAASMCAHSNQNTISNFIPTAVFQHISEILLPDSPAASEALHFLSCALDVMDSEIITPLISEEIVDRAGALIPGTYAVTRYAALFGASLIMHYEDMVARVVKNGLGEAIVEMIDSGLEKEVICCLRALSHAVFIGNRDPLTGEAVNNLICTQELAEMLNRLVMNDENNSTLSIARGLMELQEMD